VKCEACNPGLTLINIACRSFFRYPDIILNTTSSGRRGGAKFGGAKDELAYLAVRNGERLHIGVAHVVGEPLHNKS
jgi:hypothetical protein